MHGFFLVDKPVGLTSFDVVRQLKKKFQTKKIGHTGTLDPLATGCLLLAVGEYTKLISFFEKDKKSYIATITLGGISNSYDSQGEIDSISQEKYNQYKKSISLEQIESLVLQNFSGKILQTPPKVSALKIAGKRALDRFRNGEIFEMTPREATVFKILVTNYSYPYIEIELQVSAGTYVRSIAHDLGALLGCGGYISALRRTSIGNLDVSLARSLEDTSLQMSLDVTDLFPKKQCFLFSDISILQRLSNGQRISGDFNFPQNLPVFLLSHRGVEYVIEYKNTLLSPIKRIFV